ncbi:MAG TPA: peptidylprolyl isomerase [Bacteroidota bacterium]|nr:peptidylprolyl isomerase [Bacteroidota bacterium]
MRAVETLLRVLVVLVLITGAHATACAQVLDRIAAVVENDPILESELAAQVQFFIMNNRLDPNTPGLRDQVLQSMINEKLIIAKAIEDSVVVSDEEVQQQLEVAIQSRIQQVGSEARLEEAYGMPLSRIKREYRDEMRKNLLAQKLQQQRFGASQIGRFEVEEFYRTYRDSLPRVPEEVDLAHIYIRPKFGDAERTAARDVMQKILDSLAAGTDFAGLAQRHSDDAGSAPQGGNLGLVRRGQFVKEFESAVFSLGEGQTSGIVETELGMHLIQLVERRGDAVRARHILKRVQRTEAGDSSAIRLLDSLRQRILAGDNFAELAKKFSEDKETNLIGGSLGTLELEQLDKSWYTTVSPLAAGEVSTPARLPVGNSYGYHIVLVRKRVPSHTMTMEQDYHKLEQIALNYKRTKDYQVWLESLRSGIYWKIYP